MKVDWNEELERVAKIYRDGHPEVSVVAARQGVLNECPGLADMIERQRNEERAKRSKEREIKIRKQAGSGAGVRPTGEGALRGRPEGLPAGVKGDPV